MATGWWVFAAMSPTKLAPRFEPIEYEIDIAARRGRFRVPGVVETPFQVPAEVLARLAA